MKKHRIDLSRPPAPTHTPPPTHKENSAHSFRLLHVEPPSREETTDHGSNPRPFCDRPPSRLVAAGRLITRMVGEGVSEEGASAIARVLFLSFDAEAARQATHAHARANESTSYASCPPASHAAAVAGLRRARLRTVWRPACSKSAPAAAYALPTPVCRESQGHPPGRYGTASRYG